MANFSDFYWYFLFFCTVTRYFVLIGQIESQYNTLGFVDVIKQTSEKV